MARPRRADGRRVTRAVIVGRLRTAFRARPDDIARGITVEWLSIAWMIVEGAVGIGAGIRSRSIVLVAFGLDSVVELVSASALLWRLYVEAGGEERKRVESAERIASWIVGTSLLLLALYIVAASARALIAGGGPRPSPWGIGVTGVASVAMPLLAAAKKRVGKRIGSRALEADGSCSMVCAYMSWIALIGVATTALLGLWWLDAVAALGLVYFVAHEGIEALEAARG